MKKINKTIIVTLTILSILLISGCVSPSDVMDNLYTKNVYPDVIAGPFTIGDVSNPYGAGYFTNLYINGTLFNGSCNCSSIDTSVFVRYNGSTQDMNYGNGMILRLDGSIKPATLTNAAAVNDSIFYSSDDGKLAYKDASGVVYDLY